MYHKNDKYQSGGRGSVSDTIIMSNGVSVAADKESYFALDNCLLDKYTKDKNITFTGCTKASAYGVYYHQVQTGSYNFV